MTAIAPRPPATVMRLARMGSFHATRLSFMRVLLRRMVREAWTFDRPVWKIDDHGVGHAVYRVRGPDRTYSLVAFAHDLPDHLRSDRVIAEAWDATFALFDGEPDGADIDRLAENVPLQEAGRVTGRELTLSRANRSVRLFSHVVDRLAEGRQPDRRRLDDVGYLMRTTAVYGSGKFGLADHAHLCGRPELSPPFQAEMLSVFLIRWFSLDIVQHLARARNPNASTLSPDLARRLGIGNSTGLGMAPFLIRHPALLHRWIEARETALARVRTLPSASRQDWDRLRALIEMARADALAWRSEHPLQQEKLSSLRGDLDRLSKHVETEDMTAPAPWDRLWLWAESHLTMEGQERLLGLMIEPHGDLVDDLTRTMSVDESRDFPIDATVKLACLRRAIADHYGWALDTDWSTPDAQARLWYTSIEKLEPRLAERRDEPLDDYEQPLAPGRDVAALDAALANAPANLDLATFLKHAPEHRGAVRRVQLTQRHRYGEIRENTISSGMIPIDLLRCKLSFFGAGRFDPRSDRWVRINMFQGTPLPDELATCDPDGWVGPHD